MKVLQVKMSDEAHKDVKLRALKANMTLTGYVLTALAVPIKVEAPKQNPVIEELKTEISKVVKRKPAEAMPPSSSIVGKSTPDRPKPIPMKRTATF